MSHRSAGFGRNPSTAALRTAPTNVPAASQEHKTADRANKVRLVESTGGAARPASCAAPPATQRAVAGGGAAGAASAEAPSCEDEAAFHAIEAETAALAARLQAAQASNARLASHIYSVVLQQEEVERRERAEAVRRTAAADERLVDARDTLRRQQQRTALGKDAADAAAVSAAAARAARDDAQRALEAASAAEDARQRECDDAAARAAQALEETELCRRRIATLERKRREAELNRKGLEAELEDKRQTYREAQGVFDAKQEHLALLRRKIEELQRK